MATSMTLSVTWHVRVTQCRPSTPFTQLSLGPWSNSSKPLMQAIPQRAVGSITTTAMRGKIPRISHPSGYSRPHKICRRIIMTLRQQPRNQRQMLHRAQIKNSNLAEELMRLPLTSSNTMRLHRTLMAIWQK